jgi:hypothetical protein
LPFSLLLVALSRPSIVEYLGLNSPNSPDLDGLKLSALKRLATWLFKRDASGRTPLGESRNMRYLAEVVTNKEAIDALDGGQTVRAAAVLALDAAEILNVAVDESDRQLDLALRQIARVKNVPRRTVEKITSVAGKASELKEAVAERGTKRRT